MKNTFARIYLLMWLLSNAMFLPAQQQDSLIQRLHREVSDSNKVKLLNQLARSYFFSNPDSCLVLCLQAGELAKVIHFPVGEFVALNMAGEALRIMGNFPAALEVQFRAREISRKYKNKVGEAAVTNNIGLVYSELKEYRQALFYLFVSKKLGDELDSTRRIPSVERAFNLSNMGHVYEGLNILDSALIIQKQAYAFSVELNQRNLQSLSLRRLAKVYERGGEYELSLKHYRQALQNSFAVNDRVNQSIIQIGMSEIFRTLNREDSSIHYARGAFSNAQQVSQKLRLLEASNLLINIFKKRDLLDSIVLYQDIAAGLKDSLFGPEKFRQLQVLTLKEQQRQQDLIQQQERFRNTTRVTALFAILGFVLILGGVLYRNNLRKEKLNVLLESQKNEIQESLSLLKSTQAQLIQSEKMASLGELTAGIAHEIQNPLNFVNNFSEINQELLKELEGQRSRVKGERNEDLESEILKDITENEIKITHHGKRADAIVKGMLQHSQKQTGVREFTDINQLAEEYLMLAYHSYRAKDQNFTAELKLDLEPQLPLIQVIPQDIGRVLLNLYNNAFWFSSDLSTGNAMKVEALPNLSSVALAKEEGNYLPTVKLTTKKIEDRSDNNRIEISVHDNGVGIPHHIKEKIFQPFFTTKPTGEGTGLGLSLSYDIIKAHQGEIKADSKPGEGSEFIISLPIN